MRLALTSNEPRSRFLFDALKQQADVVSEIDFDDIDFVTKYCAALLSYDRPRSEWWGNYQMHPLIQRRRRKVLQRNLERTVVQADALLMWGSWFHPTHGMVKGALPFFNYIDQSRTRTPLPGEPPASILHRERSYQLQAETYESSRGIFCMSEWARRQTLEAHSVTSSKVHAVGWGPCAVNLSSEVDDSHPRKPVILHVSNDFHRKGVDFLVATAERVASVAPTVKFVVIGEDVSGMVKRDLPNVEYLGPLWGSNLEEHFRSATAFLLPQRFDLSPHVLVEAMSAGLPIIASAQGGAVELIEGKDTGFLVQTGDIEGYVSAVVSLLNDPRMRRRMGDNGRALMLEKYNWPTIAGKILDTIVSDLANPRTG